MNARSHRRSQSAENKLFEGFTLVELLLSVTILALLLTLMLSMISHVTNLVQQAEASKNRRQTARFALEKIARDLEVALFPIDRQSSNSLQFVCNPSIAPNFPNSAFWQAALSGEGTTGDIAEVGYFIDWASNPAGETFPELRRYYVPPDAEDSIHQNPTNWLTTSKIEKYAPGSDGTGNHALRGLIASHVLGLWMTLFDAEGKHLASTSYDSRISKDRPASVEVTLVVTDPRTAKRLPPRTQLENQLLTATSPEAFIDSFDQESIRSGLQIFRNRIPIYSAPTIP